MAKRGGMTRLGAARPAVETDKATTIHGLRGGLNKGSPRRYPDSDGRTSDASADASSDRRALPDLAQ